MEKLKALIKKFCTREIIFYAIFGVFTTVVNIGTFSLLTYVFHMDENTANAIAICLAVLFAYFTKDSSNALHNKSIIFSILNFVRQDIPHSFRENLPLHYLL